MALETVLPRSPFSGTPEHVADEMQKWHEQEAADGFVLRPFMSETFHQFVEKWCLSCKSEDFTTLHTKAVRCAEI
ncbi:hypothetical protein [Priestia aryabhattai]|uniref:hypothetical protein n=1 Tax=Priestia aryabhattai TaxID=412384 RepID=UPI003CF8A022